MEVVRVLRLDLLIKLALAVLLGGIIGFEREVSGKPAGLRTNILICLGATLLMDISIRIGLVDGHRIGDPGRIAAQVVTGVGFIGAGTIMQGSGVVTGLTSAATIWVVAAIGLALGGGYYVEGLGAALMVTFVLSALGRFEVYVRRLRRRVTATIRTRLGTTQEALADALRSYGILIENARIYDHSDDRTFEVKLAGPSRMFDIAEGELLGRDFILSVNFD